MGDSEEKKKPLALADCCCVFCSKPFEPEGSCSCCSCCLCPSDSTWEKFRFIVLKITEHKIFEGVILLVILVSSVSLCFEDIYLDDQPQLKAVLKILNIVFAVLFSIEMILKWISLGFKKYFTRFWTILDFCIVLVSIFDLLAEAFITNIGQISAFRALRTLRAFRPLRTVSRWQGMKIVVNALMASIPSIVNVLVVCMVFWLIFSITGVQFFKGKFYRCVDAAGSRLSVDVVKNKTECIDKGYVWKNALIHFDNVGAGYIALYQVATFEGWMEVMTDAIDSTKIDQQPRREASLAYYLFFVIFIIVGAFFTLNLFIGVIIDNFNALKKRYEGNLLDAFLTENQKNYYHTMKKLGKRKPQKTIRRPKNVFQEFFYDIAVSNKFELTIVALIFFNMIAMMLEHYKQSPAFTQCLEVVNIVFTTVFAFEAIIKILGLRWHYFRVPWNVFDFVIVLLSIVGAVLSDLQMMQNMFVTPTLLRVVRIFRIGRVLRLIKAAKGIRKLLFALVISLPALFNIGALLILIIFIYAIIGMSLFGNVKHDGAINDMVNFETFERSMVLLFRLSSSAGWNDVLYSLLIQPPNCNNTHIVRNGIPIPMDNGDCSTPWIAFIYLCSFVFFAFLIIVNMYIAVILENFNQAHEQEELGITDDDFDMFYVVWERYDPYATQYIKVDQLPDFISKLDEPLGIPKPNVVAIVSFDLPIREDDRVHCLDVLVALVRRCLEEVEDTKEFRAIKKQMEVKFSSAFPTREQTAPITTTLRRKQEELAAKTLQRAWRNHKNVGFLRAATETAIQEHRARDADVSQSPRQRKALRSKNDSTDSDFNEVPLPSPTTVSHENSEFPNSRDTFPSDDARNKRNHDSIRRPKDEKRRGQNERDRDSKCSEGFSLDEVIKSREELPSNSPPPDVRTDSVIRRKTPSQYRDLVPSENLSRKRPDSVSSFRTSLSSLKSSSKRSRSRPESDAGSTRSVRGRSKRNSKMDFHPEEIEESQVPQTFFSRALDTLLRPLTSFFGSDPTPQRSGSAMSEHYSSFDEVSLKEIDPNKPASSR